MATLPSRLTRGGMYMRRQMLGRLVSPWSTSRIRQLEHSGHPVAPKLASILRRIHAGNTLEPDLVTRIENERTRLLRDKRPLSLIAGRSGPHDDRNTVRRATRASRSARDASVLHAIVEGLSPRRVLELGTNVGISSAYMANALRDDALLTTIEASPARLQIARELHERIGLKNVDYVLGTFSEVLPDCLKSADAAIDLAFVDGHHQLQPTLDYFDLIWENASDGCVFIFDDIRWSRGMERAWKRLEADPRLALTVDLCGMGIGVSRPAPSHARRTVIPMIPA